MYEVFYGLAERPFDLTANPRFLFLASGHREALSNLQYGIESNKGITLLIGEAGTGKTTLIRAALEQQRGTSACSVYLSNPTLTRAEFFEFLANGFGLSREAGASKTVFLRELEASLHARHAAGKLTALIVDEAQSLPHELLEEVRLLANLETATSKLLPVVLTGQPELADRLNEQELRQLKQRVALRCHLPVFELRETAAYMAKRIRIAGGDSASVFTREAVEEIQRGSRGIARTISVICDNALINGFALQRRPVDADIVGDVCRDFDLLQNGRRHGASPAVDGAAAHAAPEHGARVAGTHAHGADAPATSDPGASATLSDAPPTGSAVTTGTHPARPAGAPRDETRPGHAGGTDHAGLTTLQGVRYGDVPRSAAGTAGAGDGVRPPPRKKRFLFF